MPVPPAQLSVVAEFERLIQADPAGRGLTRGASSEPVICAGHLRAAAVDLVEHGTHAVIVTGFYIPHGVPAAAETDGPPGAVVLALALRAAGISVTLATDAHCLGAVQTAARAAGLPGEIVVGCGNSQGSNSSPLLDEPAEGQPSHLIAIERPGPSHTMASLQGQSREIPAPVVEFGQRVPESSRGRCYNMRGTSIDAWTGNLHQLFEDPPQWCQAASTIGIGDGGNEIGMGGIPWETLAERISGEASSVIPCRIATDWTIVCGVSNWGGFALAAAVLCARGIPHAAADWTADFHQHLLRRMVTEGPAVDGVTGRQEPTVDGLAPQSWIQPWNRMYDLLQQEAAATEALRSGSAGHDSDNP